MIRNHSIVDHVAVLLTLAAFTIGLFIVSNALSGQTIF